MQFKITLFFLFCLSTTVFAQRKADKSSVQTPKKSVVIYTGAEFKVIKTDKNARKIKTTDFLIVNFKGVLVSNDSLIFDSYVNRPYDIPATEPTLKSYLLRLRQADSAVFSVPADSLFKYSFGADVPATIPEGDKVNFTITILDVSSKEERTKSQEEAGKKQLDVNQELISKDSLHEAMFLRAFKEVKTTGSGLKYVVEKEGKGRLVVKGDKIMVSYKGSFLDGRIFDESKGSDFIFQIGAGQVIKGWEEGLLLMNEGAHFKFIIPWQLAYGVSGQGPIPPYASLVFDIKLNKID